MASLGDVEAKGTRAWRIFQIDKAISRRRLEGAQPRWWWRLPLEDGIPSSDAESSEGVEDWHQLTPEICAATKGVALGKPVRRAQRAATDTRTRTRSPPERKKPEDAQDATPNTTSTRRHFA